MDNRRGWKTTEDVLQDLAQVTGVPYTGSNEDFIISGERPPPPRSDFEECDEELRLRLGVPGNGDLGVDNNCEGPDLDGITQCIRMAQASEPGENNWCRRSRTEKLPQTHIVISKLNPYVPEFVPKNFQSVNNVPKDTRLAHNTHEECGNGKHSSQALGGISKTFNNGAKNTKSMNQQVSQEASKSFHKNFEDNTGHWKREIFDETEKTQFVTQDETKPLDSDSLTYIKDEDKTDVIAMLKEKITTIPKDSTFDKRKDRNFAIAALVKANTIPSPVSNLTVSSSSPQPVLLTPDYFQGPSTSANLNVQDQENILFSPRIPSPKLQQTEKSQETENVEDMELEESVTPKTEVTPVRTPIDPYMQESINKVNSWFGRSPKSKRTPPEPYQGAVMFKKKSVPGKASPNSETSNLKPIEPYQGASMFKKKIVPGQDSPVSDISKSKSPVLTTPSYVPSKYAQELVKKYEERNQVKETQLDIWRKLERDLKIKDEEIKRRMKETDAQNMNNATSRRTC